MRGNAIDGTGPYEVRAVKRTLEILRLLKEPAGPVTLTKIAAATGMPKTSAFRYLATLELEGYVTRTANGAYLPDSGLAPPRAHDVEAIIRWSRRPLEQLRGRFAETISLGLLDGRRVSYLAAVDRSGTTRVEIRAGSREMVHCTAYGKALAAQLPDDRVHEILAIAGMPRFTNRTITSPDRFTTELERVRHAGYAVNDGENEAGVRCVAMALTTSAMPLAVTLSAPARRLPLSRISEVVAAFGEFDAAFGKVRGAA